MPSIKLPLEDKFFKSIIIVSEQSRDLSQGIHYIKTKEYDYGSYLFGINTDSTSTSDVVAANSYTYPNKTLFSFSKELNELIPENTYVKKIELYIYIQKNSDSFISPADIALSLQKGEPESADYSGKIYNERRLKHYFKNGWNKFEFTSDFLDTSGKFRSLNLSVLLTSFNFNRLKFTDKSLGLTTLENAKNFLVPYDSYNDSNPPYAIVECEYFPPKPADSLSPENKTVNPRTPIRFSWNTRITQNEFELSYRLNGDSYKIITQKTPNRFYELAADSFSQSSGIVNWRIRVKDGQGVWSEYKEASFTLGVPEQAPPRLVYPTGSYVKNTEPLEFSWAFVADTIEKQSKFILEYRINNSEWKSMSGNSEKTSYTLDDIKYFGTATGQWRVKVTNNYGQESGWSEIGKFQIYGVPPTPQIVSINNKSFPTIKWYSEQQEMFRVTVLDKEDQIVFDSGYILDYINKEYKIPKVINNGKYTFILKIKNKYGIESEQTKLTQNIEVIHDQKIEFDIFKSDYYVEIVSENLDFKVIRNNEIIGNSNNGSFKDFTGANGKYYKYQIMTESNDEVNLSREKNGKVDFNGCTLSNLKDPSNFIILRYNINERPNRSLEFGINANEIEIEGSKYPFIEYGDLITDQKTYDFFVEDKDEIIKMLEKKEEFLIRDYYGDNICGLIKNIGLNKNRFGYELNFTILRTSDKYE